MNTVVHYYGLTRIRVKYCTRDDPEYLCHALRYFTFVSFTLNYMASFYNQRPCNYTFCSFYLELFTCTHIRSIDTLSTFKRHLKFHLFQSASTVRMYEGPSGGSRAAAAVADGCREVDVVSSSVPGDWSLSTCISATTIPVDTWPPISSGSA